MSRTESQGLQRVAFEHVTGAELDEREAYLGPFAQSVRELVDATIRTTVPEDEIVAAQAEIEAITRRLREQQLPGPAGIGVNAEGRSWQWGNAAVGLRNAVAPPMVIIHDDSGLAHCDVVLGAAYEGPPGLVHGGVSALLLDQLMGETASGFRHPMMTGTLTLRYRQPTPLGPVRLQGRISSHRSWTTTVLATIAGPDGVTVEAEGIFVMPRWARERFPMPGTE